ncbi:MAG: MFS transporter [Myxococcota bacterium]|jgi:MFS family permease|nr:MFS transporter [Myxococcota bacterium]
MSSARLGFWQQIAAMSRSFWTANLLDALERWAYYAVRAVLPLYLVDVSSGGLGLSFTQKGMIFMVWALVQCLVPMFSGGYTERYGYRRSLMLSFAANIAGYLLMAYASSFAEMMLAGVLVGFGTAVFKPPIQGAIARSLSPANSALGFGIFYWIINLGGSLAPFSASWARGDAAQPTWTWVFYGAALLTVLNLALSLALFPEPTHTTQKQGKGAAQVFTETLVVLWQDRALLRFLLVISGFWFMFMQVWDLLPNFLAEWVDTRDVGAALRAVLGEASGPLLDANGAAKPEILIGIDGLTIILLALPLSWAFGKRRMMSTLVLGMSIAVSGFVGTGMTPYGWVAAFMVFVFAVGEILCSPKFSEYIGMNAPEERKALYMGYSNIPFAIGWAAGNGISGPLYEHFASRTHFAKAYLLDAGHDAATVEAMSPEHAIELIAQGMHPGANSFDATALLWELNHPWILWLILGSVGLASLLGMHLLSRRPSTSAEKS